MVLVERTHCAASTPPASRLHDCQLSAQLSSQQVDNSQHMSARAVLVVCTRPCALPAQASGLAPAVDDARLNGTLFTPTDAAVMAFMRTLNITQVELLAAAPTLLANVGIIC